MASKRRQEAQHFLAGSQLPSLSAPLITFHVLVFRCLPVKNRRLQLSFRVAFSHEESAFPHGFDFGRRNFTTTVFPEAMLAHQHSHRFPRVH